MTRPVDIQTNLTTILTSDRLVSHVGNAKTMSAIRLLTLGYAILEHRFEEVDGVYKSTIYKEDYMELLGASSQNALAVLRKGEKELKEIVLTLETKETFKAVESVVYSVGKLCIVWNQDIVYLLSSRVNFFKNLEDLCNGKA